MIYPAILTPAVAAAICERSAAGEGVLAIISDMKLPAETLDWLKKFHHGSIVAAKLKQIQNKEAALQEKEQCATTPETSTD